jgi:hypothetical protein
LLDVSASNMVARFSTTHSLQIWCRCKLNNVVFLKLTHVDQCFPYSHIQPGPGLPAGKKDHNQITEHLGTSCWR